MTLTKKLLTAVLAAFLALSLTACPEDDADTNDLDDDLPGLEEDPEDDPLLDENDLDE